VSCYVLPIFGQVEPTTLLYCCAVIVLIAIAPAVSFGVEFVIVVAVANCFCFCFLFSAVVFVVAFAISVVVIKELDQGYLHPSIKPPETDMSRPEFEPPTSSSAGGHPTKELFEQLINCQNRNFYIRLLFRPVRNLYIVYVIC
jgi:hypothetical protein